MIKKILFITQKRSDAIGLVDKEVKKELSKIKHHFEFFELKKKGNKKLKIIINYIINIFIILIKSFSYNKIYFSWENPYVIFVKFFFPWKKIYLCVHHVEDYRGEILIGKLILKSIYKFVAISSFTKDQLIQLGVNEKKIFINYNGISNDFHPEMVDNFQKFDYILYVGTEVERKNIKNLLLAFSKVVKKYPKLKLIKIGKAVENQEETDFLVKKMKLENNIVFKREFIANEDLRRYYSNAVCYISVSKLEGFGLTIPEAMACACPVVASNIPPFKEIIGDSQIIVNPNNVDKIFDGIILYIENKDFRKQMSKEGIEISRKFNWKKNVENMANILL